MALKKLQLGEALVKNNLLTSEQLATALAEQKKTGLKLGEVVVQLNYIPEETLLNFLAEQLQIPFIDLKHYTINPEAARLLSEVYARRFNAIILKDSPDQLLVGLSDPLDIRASDELARILKRPIDLALVRREDLLLAYDIVYRRTKDIAHFATELSEELHKTDFDLSQLAAAPTTNEAPVIKLLQSIFEDSVQMGASDIHIEPGENLLRIRQRVDGVLQEYVIKDSRIAPALAQRLKLMGRLNIAEKRLPQDGRFSIKVRDRTLDVRLATMPVQNGEALVMRLLDTTASTLQLEQLGMPEFMLKTLRKYMQMSYGMILLTGPTGSGKTTTLYSMLKILNSVEKKIITVEDPVEYRLPGINQVQVNETIGLDFGRVLRTALRHDPDIIMVGEIRDQETSSIALRAAITGHLVLATMHTNDALSCATRLLDLGSEGFMIASALRVVIAQRLLRRICKNCTEPYTPSTLELAWLERELPQGNKLTGLLHGVGCSFCNNTGYKGRIGIYEMLEINDEMNEALRSNNASAFIKAAQKTHYRTLTQSGLDLIKEGTTTIAELWRVTTGLID